MFLQPQLVDAPTGTNWSFIPAAVRLTRHDVMSHISTSITHAHSVHLYISYTFIPTAKYQESMKIFLLFLINA